MRYSDMPSTERIPAVLMNPFLNKGHILFTDNYYTSPTLGLYFLQNGTHLVGTVRNNRRFSPRKIWSKLNLKKVQLHFITVIIWSHANAVPYKIKEETSKK